MVRDLLGTVARLHVWGSGWRSMDVFHGGILVGGLRWAEWRIPGCFEIVGMALREISHSHFRIMKSSGA
jgi:hypothetical protein